MSTGKMPGGVVRLATLAAAVGWLGMAHAQPMPKDYDPGKNRATAERAAAEQAAAAKQQAEAERRRREAAEAKAADAESRAAELKRELAEAKRKAEDTQKQAETQKKVGAGAPATTPTPPLTQVPPSSFAPLAVFRDRLSDGTQGPEMVVIPAGSFEMGSNDGDSNEKLVHTVRIAKGFALGKTEVTQAQWRQVMGSDWPELQFKGCDACPVENVSWDDAQAFIRRLNALTGKTYRLPSEAEWEYAAKAGGNFRYSGGKDIDAVAWYDKNSGNKTHPVGQKTPNAWGLYDMTGNVWEWVEDIWHDNYMGAPTDGSSWVTGGEAGRRVLRGGSRNNEPAYARAASRIKLDTTYRSGGTGFRLARMLP